MMEYGEELMHSIIAELDEPLSLEHIGVKGKSGRYPWGSGNRPYQRLEGTSQAPSRRARHSYDKKRKALAKQAERAQAKQQKKQQKADVKAAKEQAHTEEEARKEQEKIQKEKDEALKDPTKLAAARKKYEFTKEEIDAALQSFEWDRRINQYSEEKMARAANKMDTILGYGKKAVNFYNFTAGIVNSVDPDSKLPILKLDRDNREAIKKREKDERVAKQQEAIRRVQYEQISANAEVSKQMARQAAIKTMKHASDAGISLKDLDKEEEKRNKKKDKKK